jgi:hypothetical protein
MATSITPHSYTADGSKTPPPAGTLTLAENLILPQAEALIRATGAEIRIGGTRPFRLVQRSGRCVVRELHDGGGNPSR